MTSAMQITAYEMVILHVSSSQTSETSLTACPCYLAQAKVILLWCYEAKYTILSAAYLQ